MFFFLNQNGHYTDFLFNCQLTAALPNLEISSGRHDVDNHLYINVDVYITVLIHLSALTIVAVIVASCLVSLCKISLMITMSHT